MTARSIRGSSSASGIWSRRSPTRIRFTPGWKTRRCFAQPMAARTGRNSRGCAATAPARSGSQARAACACTRSFSIPDPQSIMTERASTLRSRRRVPFAPTTAARRGNRSTAVSTRNTFPNPRRGWPLRSHIAMNPSRPGRALHAEALGRDALGRCRRVVANQRQSSDRLRLRDRRARARAGDYLCRAHQERLASICSGGQAARLPQPQRRQRVGGAHRGLPQKELLRECAARCDGGRFAG
jgi:hypothetical protein